VLGVFLAVVSLYHAFSSSYVQQNQIYTQALVEGSSFTALSASDVPMYNAGGFPVIPGSQTQVYAFDWFVFATDSLRPFLLVYTLVAVILAVLVPLDTLTALLYQPVVVIFLLIELAKLVYFALIGFELFGFSCVAYAFCRNRNPAITATPDTAFFIAVASTVLFVIVDIALTVLPGTVKKAHLSSDPIGNQLLPSAGKVSPPVSDFELDEYDQPSVTYRTKPSRKAKRRSKRPSSASESSSATSGVHLIMDMQ